MIHAGYNAFEKVSDSYFFYFGDWPFKEFEIQNFILNFIVSNWNLSHILSHIMILHFVYDFLGG